MRVDSSFATPPVALLNDATQVKRLGAEQQDPKKVASDFSGLLVQQMVREMFESVKEGEGPFGDGPGADIQRGIAESAISQSLATQGFGALREAIERAIRVHENLSNALPSEAQETKQ